MLRGRSWIRRFGVAIALFAALCGSAIPIPHAEGLDDPVCSPTPVAHDESAHYVGADSAPDEVHADHCFVCHTLRSFHSAFDTFTEHDDASHAERLHLAPIDRAGLVEWTLVLGRAPPV